MPFVIICDHCQSKLRSAAELPIQRKLKCPKCEEIFQVTEKNQHELPAGSTPTPLPPAKPARPQAGKTPVKKIEIEGADVVDDDEEETPRQRRGRTRDEEERPRSKASRSRSDEDEDDEEDEKPRSKAARSRSEESDEEDDRPSARRRKTSDDDGSSSKSRRRKTRDDDDRPRRKKKQGPAKSSNQRMPLFIGGGVVLVLLIGIGLYIAFSGGSKDKNKADAGGQTTSESGSGSGSGGNSKSNGGPSNSELRGVPVIKPSEVLGEEARFRPKRALSKETLAYCPNDQYSISYSDMALGREFGDTGMSAYMNNLPFKEFGITPENVACYCQFNQVVDNSSVSVFTFNADYDLARLLHKSYHWRFEKAKEVNGITIWRGDSYTPNSRASDPSTQAFQPKPRVVVFIQRHGLLDTKLAEELAFRKPGDSKISDERWQAMQELSGYPHITVSKMTQTPGESKVGRAPANLEAEGRLSIPGHAESLDRLTYASFTKATTEKERHEEFSKQIEAAIAGRTTETSEKFNWIRGKVLYLLDKVKNPVVVDSGPKDGTEGVEAPIRLKRDLPKDLFAYWPNDQYGITDWDLALSREIGDGTQRPHTISSLPPIGLPVDRFSFGNTYDQLAQYIHFWGIDFRTKSIQVHVLVYNKEFDLAKAVEKTKDWKFEEAKEVNGIQIWRGESTDARRKGIDAPVLAFQPKPRVVVVLQREERQVEPLDTQLGEELLRRGPEDTKIPSGLWRALQEVSGYPEIHVPAQYYNSKFGAYGSLTLKTSAEYFRCEQCADFRDAQQEKKSTEKDTAKMDAENPKPAKREHYKWIKGSILFSLDKETYIK